MEQVIRGVAGRKNNSPRIRVRLHFDKKNKEEFNACATLLEEAFGRLRNSGKEEFAELEYALAQGIDSADLVIASPRTLKGCEDSAGRAMPVILLLPKDEWDTDTAQTLSEPAWDIRGLFRFSKLDAPRDPEELCRFTSALKELVRDSLRQRGEAREETLRKPLDWKAKLTTPSQAGFISLFSASSMRVMARHFKNAVWDIKNRLPLGPGSRPPSLLLLGETGCGKTLLARAAADALFPGEEGHFLRLNISAYTNDLIDVELFGAKKGAFTGCDEDRDGAFAAIKGKAVFLDEIGDMEPRNQIRLLTYMDDGCVIPRGTVERSHVPCVLVAATNKSLHAGSDFREDLLCRFDHTVTIPPLRDRREDMRLLISLTLQDEEINPNRKIGFISLDTIKSIENRPFPGNFRELRFTLRQAVNNAVAAGSDCLCLRHLPD